MRAVTEPNHGGTTREAPILVPEDEIEAAALLRAEQMDQRRADREWENSEVAAEMDKPVDVEDAADRMRAGGGALVGVTFLGQDADGAWVAVPHWAYARDDRYEERDKLVAYFHRLRRYQKMGLYRGSTVPVWLNGDDPAHGDDLTAFREACVEIEGEFDPITNPGNQALIPLTIPPADPDEWVVEATSDDRAPDDA